MAEDKKLMLAKEIKGRQELLQRRRYKFETVLKDIGEHIHPVREDIDQTKQQGEQQGLSIYDATGMDALNTFANGLYGNMISPAFKWFKLGIDDDEIMERFEVKQWLEDVERHIYKVFNNSNFYDVSFPWMKDGIGMGTATMYPQEDIENEGVHYLTIHPGQVYVAMNDKMIIDTLHRKFKYTAKQIRQKFPDAKLPEVVTNALAQGGNPFTEFEVLHAVFPNEDYDPISLSSIRKKFLSVWMITEANDDESILRISGFRKFPYIVWLYEQNGMEEYGRCPGMYALADMAGLNLMSKHLLGAAEKSVDPPMNVPDDMPDENINLMPRGMNYYEDPNKVITPVNTGINFPVGIDREEAKQEAIRKHFFVDFFLMLQNAERGLTATEVMERQGEKASVLGPAMGRLNRSLDAIIERTFEIEWEAKRLPPPPPAIEQMGMPINISYQGPLAQIQKRLFETQGITRTLATLEPVFAIWPETIQTFNGDEIARALAGGGGMPAITIRSREDVAESRRAEQAQQEAAMAMQDMATAAKATKDVSQAAGSGSPLSLVGEELLNAGAEAAE